MWMSLRQKYRRVLSELLHGAVGLTFLLGSTTPGAAGQPPQPAVSDHFSVSERLAAIRQAVSDVAGNISEARESELQLAWGNWRNGGWRNGGWRNWGNGWHNGGWHNWWHNW
jgi:hypothetical protein